MIFPRASKGLSLVITAGLPLCLDAATTPHSWNTGGTGGDGVWGTGPADTNWNTAVGALAPNYAWPNTAGSVATFQDNIGGTTSIFGQVSATGIQQNGADYGIEGGTLRLIPGTAGESPFIAVETGTMTVTATIAGTAGITKTGAGILNLSGFNTFTGPTAINGGTMVLAGPDQLPDGGALSIGAGSTLTLAAGTETVASLISNGGTVSGTGVLGAASFALNHGSSVAGNLGNGAITTTGSVSISGNTGSGPLVVAGGTLDFTGSSSATAVRIDSGATLLGGANLADAANVSNAGTLAMQGLDVIYRYVSDGGTLSGTGTLTAGGYVLQDGSSVSGNLGGGVLISHGAVSITGNSAAGSVNISSGNLSLDGDNLSDLAAVTVAHGAGLHLGGSETIGSLISYGGTLSGPGTLTASSYILNDGSVVSGNLGSGVLETHGTVESSGTIGANTIHIVDGTLVNVGTLGTSATWIDIGGGASLVAGGAQNFARLTTAGGTVGTWVGNLANAGMAAPGDDGSAGTLRVEGDFTTTGTLSLEVGAAGYDLLQVSGHANFGGALEVSRFGAEEIEALVPLQVVEAGSYSGTFASMSEDLDGVLFFNPGNGTLTRLGYDDGAAFLGRATSNQVSTWIALYDDVVDPGTRNAFHLPSQRPPFSLSSGVASPDEPDLLSALGASLGPAGLDGALLNRLSPEVYGSLSEYSLQALRNHHRSARTAPALAAGGGGGRYAALVPGGSGKGGMDAKNPAIIPPSALAPVWEVFAATGYFNTGTDASLNQGDYDLSGAGIIAGARFSPKPHLRFSAWLAGDEGSVDEALIDADARGFAFGLGGEALIPASNREIRVSAGLSYGTWEFDGNRGSASATAGGWSPGPSSFPDADADAFDAFIGVDSVVWRTETLRLTPSLGLAYSSATSDAFREVQGGAGSPIPLAVDGAGRDSLSAQLGLDGELRLSRSVTLDGGTGMQLSLKEETERISGRFAGGSRPMSAILAPLSDDLFYLGAGATWRANERCQIRLGYRAEFRSDADPLNALNLSGSWRF